MAITLQEAIDFATAPPFPDRDELGDPLIGIRVIVTISAHDDEDTVLLGQATGLSSMFRPDLPLLNWGTPARPIFGPATRGIGSLFSRGPAPGFSTRGLGPVDGAGASLGVVEGSPVGGSIPIDFSVRKDPGIPRLSSLGMGPSVQIEIETLSAPAPGGTATAGIKLQVAEDGALLRAVGPSLQDSTRRASYTATINVWPNY